MHRRNAIILLASMAIGVQGVDAQQARPADRGRPITYVKRGTPVRRVSAGVRGYGDVPLDRQPVVLIAPHDHVAWTVRTQPTLFWRYAGQRDQVARVVLRLTRGTHVDSMNLTITSDGLQRIVLAKLGVSLGRDVDYQWSVHVVRRDASLSPETDVAWIRVVGANTLGTEPNDPVDLARAAAAVGLWYDAFAALTAAREQSPDDESLGSACADFVSSTVRGLTLSTSSTPRTPQ